MKAFFPHGHNYPMFKLIIHQGYEWSIQPLPIQKHFTDMAGHMLGVIHLNQIHGFSKSITNLKSIPSRWNDRSNVQALPDFFETENSFQPKTVHPCG